MAAPRASSFKALRNLQKSSTSTPARRGLHITGVNSSPRPLDPVPKHAYIPLTLQDLRSECRKRTLGASGTKHELVDRLAAHDALQARAFSIAMKKVAGEQARKPLGASSPAEKVPSRHFNTSRANKAVNDSSTIDFAYLPKLFEGSFDPQPAEIRVPILPHIESDDAAAVLAKHAPEAAVGAHPESESVVMKPQIVTVTETLADGAHVDLDLHSHASAMSDVHDNHAMEMSVDALSSLSHTVGQSARRLAGTGDEQGAIRRIWSGLLDDIFGPKAGSSTKTA